MSLSIRCLTVTILSALPVFSQAQQFAALGDFRLESGETIRNLRLGYRTYGKLNADRSNVILWPTWFTGRTEQLAGNFGPGKLIDTDTWYVVTVDAIGNGVSSSPSNSADQPRMKFPLFTIRDMVNSQHKLLTTHLGIGRVHAVMGISMGGMQTYQWLVSYPEFMTRGIPIVGTPRLGSSDRLLWTAEAMAIQRDKDWNNGEYKEQPAMLATRLMHTFALQTPEWRNRETEPHEFPELMQKTERDTASFDASDWLRQLQAMLSHDIYAGGPVEGTAKKIRARVLMVLATQDHMVSPQESMALAKVMGIEPVLLTGDCGHVATGCEADKMGAAIRAFLGKPGE